MKDDQTYYGERMLRAVVQNLAARANTHERARVRARDDGDAHGASFQDGLATAYYRAADHLSLTLDEMAIDEEGDA
jgi:hypothetical protein